MGMKENAKMDPRRKNNGRKSVNVLSKEERNKKNEESLCAS